MSRRLAALVLLVALALAGSAAVALAGAGRDACSMGRSCPIRSAEGARCPARAAWSVELGCCAPSPAAPPAPAPTVACPYSGDADAAPAVLVAVASCPQLSRHPDLSRERARAARLHDLGLSTLFSALLI